MKNIICGALAVLTLSGPALADSDFKTGDWMLRARALGVVPQEDTTLTGAPGHVNVNNSVVPEFDLSYFFTPNISAELIAAVTPHDVKTSTGVDAGNAWLLPPTLTVQYHFNQLTGIKPYVGAGVNYTYFFNEDAGALTSVKYDNSFGGAFQAGVDIQLKDNWYANIDVKKVYISTTAKFSPSGVRADVDIDPWLIGVGVGYKF